MAGIYIHIPFCKVKCSYCDFYKTTNNAKIQALVNALKLELWLRRDYLTDPIIETIYFGGGTPSLLSPHQLEDILRACNSVFKVHESAEITFEANPDDLSVDYLKAIRQKGINRLSIGVQSFSQTDLKLMKRRHNPLQALNAVRFAREAGFSNISVDLIYGIPNMPFEQWQKNLSQVFSMEVEHVSAYHLTYHQGTSLWDDLQKGKIHEIDEKESVDQFNELIKTAREHGFIHYEISNFARDGYFSRHNSSYWNQTQYLGLGPSAHSYDTISRQWNVASLTHYLLALSNRKIPFEREELGKKERFNDYMITALRTMWGINLVYVKREFGTEYLDHIENVAGRYLKSEQLCQTEDNIKLAGSGWFVSDAIMSEFMLSP
jgi:oxygen-independent coproporphyrinogen III oxidase